MVKQETQQNKTGIRKTMVGVERVLIVKLVIVVTEGSSKNWIKFSTKVPDEAF